MSVNQCSYIRAIQIMMSSVKAIAINVAINVEPNDARDYVNGQSEPRFMN